MRKLIILSIACLLAVTCSSSPKIKDISELFPPKRVRVYAEDGGYRVSWDASIDEERPDFLGYNLYVAPYSLIKIAVEDLPPPILVDKTEHDYKLTDLDPTVQYFIHLRSRNKDGDISLPSQPEIAVQTTATF